MLAAFSDPGTEPNLLKENCLSLACARHAAIIETTRLRSAANTQLDMKGVIRQEVKSGQNIVKTSSLIAINLAADMMLGTPYNNEIIENIILKNSTLKPSGSSFVAIEESIGNSTSMKIKKETEQSNPEDKYKEYPCTASCQRIITPMSKAFLYVSGNDRGVHLVE